MARKSKNFKKKIVYLLLFFNRKFGQNNEDVFHSVSEIMNESKEETPNELSLNELCKDDDKNMDFWVFGQTSPQYY